MGMAAGQARLLSITSRMSDNELRAQIINNNKMRLATESSQVSEAYVNALNEAQYMFTNYDANDCVSYQALTFNALTSYNPYNNQYALVNSSGQILISETDAANYNNSRNLEEFLGCYGLEKSTSYFDVLNTDSSGYATYTYYDEDGRVFNASSGFTPEVLKAAYFGESDSINTINMIGGSVNTADCGYDNVLNGTKMYEYTSALGIYTQKKDAYMSIISTTMNNKLDDLIKNSSLGTYPSVTSLSTLLAYISEQTERTSTTPMYYNNFNDNASTNTLYDRLFSFYTTTLQTYASDDGRNYLNDAAKVFDLDNGGIHSRNNSVTEAAPNQAVVEDSTITPNYDTNGNIISYTKVNNGYKTVTPVPMGGLNKSAEVHFDQSGRVSSVIVNYKDAHDAPAQATCTPSGANKYKVVIMGDEYEIEITDINITPGTPSGTYPAPWTDTPGSGTFGANNSREDSPQSKVLDAIQMLQQLKANLTTVWDATNPAFVTSDARTQSALQAYVDAGNELYKVIYGRNGSYTALAGGNNSGPPSLSKLDNIAYLYNEQGPGCPAFDPSFRPVYMNIVLDNIMDTYGEPKLTWVNSVDPNDNSEKRTQWYTNLYNRIVKSGFHTLKDGLASSPEWIKFAFESGIVTMEQVDSFNEWNKLIYTNCSDITEQTNDKAVTIAEAEYNAAMNKIENKDKRYDLELKNIDTEHNSLQVEYDSIETALNKHIERNFKYFS